MGYDERLEVVHGNSNSNSNSSGSGRWKGWAVVVVCTRRSGRDVSLRAGSRDPIPRMKKARRRGQVRVQVAAQHGAVTGQEWAGYGWGAGGAKRRSRRRGVGRGATKPTT